MSAASDRRDARRLEDRIRNYNRDELVTLRQWIGDIVSPEEKAVIDGLIQQQRLTALPSKDR
jgi:hypothetical protein